MPDFKAVLGAGVIAALFVVGVAAPAAAEVIEITPSGQVVTYSGPRVFTQAGVEVIELGRAPVTPSSKAPADVIQLIGDAARRNGVSPRLVEAVAWRESAFRQDAVSPKGAVGVMQLTSGTARDLGVDRHDLRQNIDGGAAYLGQLLRRYGGDLRLTLAAYNAGPGAVDRHGGVPPYLETTNYVAAVLRRLSHQE